MKMLIGINGFLVKRVYSKSSMSECPFSVGDIVRFCPSDRTRGWYQDIEAFGVKIGQEIEIKRIKDGVYLYFENEAGGWPWDEFELVREKKDK